MNVSKTEDLVNDILNDLVAVDEKEEKQNIKAMISTKIYLNTIKKKPTMQLKTVA